MRRWLMPMLAACNGEEKRCETFVDDATACYDSFCSDDGSDAAFCACWDQGEDIDISTCDCVPLDLTLACDALDLSDYEEAQFDCDAATALVEDICDE